MLLDNVLAERRSRTTPGFVTHPEPVAVSHYVGVLAPGNEALRDRIDQILREAMKDGRLEAIYRKWKIWNEDQPQLFSRAIAGDAISPVTGYQTDSIATLPKWEATRRYLPSLLRAAVITLVLSCGAMLLPLPSAWRSPPAGSTAAGSCRSS